MGVHIDSFSHPTVSDLKKSMRHENGVLYALNYYPRVSTWDMSENPWLCKIIKSLEEKDFIVPLDEPYPWHKWELTEAGKAQITI